MFTITIFLSAVSPHRGSVATPVYSHIAKSMTPTPPPPPTFHTLSTEGMEDLTNYAKRTAIAQHSRDQIAAYLDDIMAGKRPFDPITIRRALGHASLVVLSQRYRQRLLDILKHHDQVAARAGLHLSNHLTVESVTLYLYELDKLMRADGKEYEPDHFKQKLSALFTAGKKTGRVMPSKEDSDHLKDYAILLGEAVGSDKDVRQATPVRPIMIRAIQSMLGRSSAPSLRDRVFLVMIKVHGHSGIRSCEATDNCMLLQDVTCLPDGSVLLRLTRTKTNKRPCTILLHPLGEEAADVCGARALHEWVHTMYHHFRRSPSSFLFPEVEGNTFTSGHWQQQVFSSTLKSYVRSAGCAFLYPGQNDPTGHGFRRAVTTIAEEEGVSTDFVTRYLRWSTILATSRVRYTHSTQVVAQAIAAAITSAYRKELARYPPHLFRVARPPAVPAPRAASPVPRIITSAPLVTTRQRPAPSASACMSPMLQASYWSSPSSPSSSPFAPTEGAKEADIARTHQSKPVVVRVDEDTYQAAGYGVGMEQYLAALPLPAKRLRNPVQRLDL